MSATPDTTGSLSLEDVARRLRRGVRNVQRMVAVGEIGYVVGRPPTILETQLWDYLISRGLIWPDAFGEEPRSDAAEAALSQARDKVLCDRLATIDLEAKRYAPRHRPPAEPSPPGKTMPRQSRRKR